MTLPSRTQSRLVPYLLLLASLVLLAACAQTTSESPSEASVAESAASASAPAAPSEEWNGMPVGFTDDGHPYRGSPDAPLTLFEWSDYQCPFCSRYFVQTEPAINDAYVREGRVRVVFRDLPIEQLHPNAPAAHEAARCISDQGAPLFWAMHDELFRSQGEWQGLQDPRLVFERLAAEIGADVEAMKACVEEAAQRPQIEDSLNQAASLGLDGTPSFQIVDKASGDEFFLIGAQPFERFAATLDALLAGEAPPDAERPAQAQEIPFWATPDGLAVDPARPGHTVAGDQTRGSPDAKVVVVEFSDFQCPYCKRHSLNTQPEIDRRFVDAGTVRWVFKHFPLSIHPQAPAAGIAAECADAQGQHWAMGDKLFATVDEWSIADPTPVFVRLAGELGLDADAFAACLVDPAMLAAVDADTADGRPFVQGTPTFIILSSQGGRIIPGALPLETFAAELQKAVDAAGS